MSLIANSKKPKVLKKNITNNNTPRISYTFTKISNKASENMKTENGGKGYYNYLGR
jgi:hypothetical protein